MRVKLSVPTDFADKIRPKVLEAAEKVELEEKKEDWEIVGPKHKCMSLLG